MFAYDPYELPLLPAQRRPWAGRTSPRTSGWRRPATAWPRRSTPRARSRPRSATARPSRSPRRPATRSTETVTLKVTTPKAVRFPLYLRVPRWCAGAKVAVNGKASTSRPSRSRTWWSSGRGRAATRSLLELPMPLAATVWEKNQKSVSVSRGPLWFSLRIGEEWKRYGGTDAWPAMEVHPTSAVELRPPDRPERPGRLDPGGEGGNRNPIDRPALRARLGPNRAQGEGPADSRVGPRPHEARVRPPAEPGPDDRAGRDGDAHPDGVRAGCELPRSRSQVQAPTP